jgi:hypothetical protein
MTDIRAFLKRRKRLQEFLELIGQWSREIGFDPRKFIRAVLVFSPFLREYLILKKQNERDGSKWNVYLTRPRFQERSEPSGTASGHYFHQDLLVARRIFLSRPVKHVDVGSRIDGFVAHVAAFRPIEVVDLRPQTNKIPNVTFWQHDLTSLPPEWVGYCDSLSCLHVLEHFGLGRYGDALDINGYRRGNDSLPKKLRQNGNLYLSVSIGAEPIQFNTPSVFSVKTIKEMAQDRFELAGFSYVDDEGDLHEDAVIDPQALADNFGLLWGCGIFEFRKL